MKLIWDGPYTFLDILTLDEFRNKYKSKSGVYLWIEDLQNMKRLYYIGKASGSPCLWMRHLQHYAYAIGGIYSMPKEYTKTGIDWKPNWWESKVSAVLLDKAKFKEIVDYGFDYTNHMRLYFAEHSGNVSEVERQLLFDLQPTGTDWGTKSPPGNPINIEHINATWYSNTLINKDTDKGKQLKIKIGG